MERASSEHCSRASSGDHASTSSGLSCSLADHVRNLLGLYCVFRLHSSTCILLQMPYRQCSPSCAWGTPDLSTPVECTHPSGMNTRQMPGISVQLVEQTSLQAQMATLVGEKKWVYTFFCEVHFRDPHLIHDL